MSIDYMKASLLMSLPPVLFRTDPDFKRLTGISSKTMANLDSQDKGPLERVVFMGQIGYPRHSFVEWWAGNVELEERNS